MKLRGENGGCYLRPAALSKAFGLRNLSYSKISVEMLLGYMIAGISRKLESNRQMPCAQMLHILISSVIHALCENPKQ